MTQQDILKYGVKLIVIFLCLPVHEFAHAWSARKLGDTTQDHKGRLTLNPLAHLDLFGAVCLFLTGFGWAKPVQVESRMFKNFKRDMAITAAAGPISNLFLAFFGAILWKITLCCYWVKAGFSITDITENTSGFSTAAYYQIHAGNDALFWLQFILFYFVMINVGLAVFNFIPVPPLDGSKILMFFLPDKTMYKMYEYQMYFYIGFIVVLMTGLLDIPLGLLRSGAFFIIDMMTVWVPSLMEVIL
ncbi:site-2 protease family protein [Ruminococcus sp. NK3A76]|uniref:site-2 protease family protein n=1 Tax=Ruminococcus sp. NK3A76 TaxID=877411 RepID=UPI00048A57F2|nr:site-2 protease family protein [Ruminococcus sp. NK3A76]